MIVTPHQPQCYFQQNKSHKAFDSRTFKYKDSHKYVQPEVIPQYKSAGGILRHQTKFGDDHYALVQGHRHKKWSFPKGHLQDNETPYMCALREITEETGITFLPFPITSLQIGFGYYYIFEVEEEYPLRPRDKDEIMATKWVTLQEMQEMDTNTDVSAFLRMTT